MTEKDFLSYNERLKQRQAAIQDERKQAEPVLIGELIRDVMDDIQRRRVLAGGSVR